MNQEQIYSSSQRERDWAVLNFRKEPWSPASPASPAQSQSVTWGFPDVFYGLNQNPIVRHNSKGQTAEEWKLKKKWRMDERGLRGLFLHEFLSLIRVKTEWFNDCPTRKNGANLTKQRMFPFRTQPWPRFRSSSLSHFDPKIWIKRRGKKPSP